MFVAVGPVHSSKRSTFPLQNAYMYARRNLIRIGTNPFEFTQ